MISHPESENELPNEPETLRARAAALERDKAELQQNLVSLRASEERWRSVVANAPNYILTLARDATILTINRLPEGKTADEIVGKKVTEFLPAEIHAVLDRGLENVFRTGTSCAFENRAPGPDGITAWYDTRIGPITENGNVVSAVLVGTNITARKRVEEELRVNEERFRSLMEHTAEGFYLFEVPEPISVGAPIEEQIRQIYRGAIVECNDAQARMYGYSQAKEVIGKNLAELHGEVNKPENIAFLRTWIEGGYRITGALSCEVDRNGSEVWFANNVVGVVEDGQLLHIWGTQIDVTERIQAEEDLRREKQRAQEYLDIAGTILVALNDRGEITLINKKGCEVLGYDEAELIGQSWFDRCLVPAKREAVKRTFARLIAGELEPREYVENPVLTKFGTERLIAWHNTVLRDKDGRITGTLSSGEDITVRKKAEEELRRYEHIVASSTDMLALLDVDYVYLAANPAYREAFDKSHDELIGRTVPEVFGEEFFHQTIKPNAERCLAGEEVRYQAWVEFPAHGRRHMDISYFPYVGDDEQVRGFAVHGRDITDRRKAEGAVRESEERFRQLAEAIPEVFWVGTPFWNKVLYVSPAYEKVWGRPRIELYERPRSWLEAVVEEDRAALTAVIKARHPDDTAAVIFPEYRIVRPDGSMRWIAARAFPIQDEHGKVYRIAGIAEDITERKQAEAALRESQSRLQQIADTIEDVFWMADWVTRKTLFASPAFEAIWGRSLESLYADAQCWAEAIHHDDRRRAWERFVQLGEGEAYDEEYRIIRPDGSIRWIRDRGFPVHDESGKVYRVAGTAQDITKRKEAEEALRESEETARALVNASPDGAMLIDRAGNLLALNAIAAKRLKKSTDELIGTCVFDAFAPEIVASRRARHEELLRTRETLRLEDERGGRIYDTQAYPILDASGEVARVAVFARDITDQRRAERERQELEARLHQSQKMEAIGQLAGGVAHDFNNVLTAIIGNTEMLLTKMDQPWNERITKLVQNGLEEVMSAAQRAAELTRQLLTLGRKGATRPSLLDLGQVLRDDEEMLRRFLREDIVFDMVVAPDTCSIRADKTQVGQVILNLVLNARDAMPEGGTLSVTCGNADVGEGHAAAHVDARPGPHVMLAVRDTGVGMTKETAEHMFEPFFTTKPTGRGTGLGLATVYGILKRAEAHVAVESRLGEGTTMRVYFPAVVDEAGPQEKPDSASRLGGEGLILVCEDEKAVRWAVCENLRAEGYTVLEAHDGKNALEVAADSGRKIELLISDVVMPEMNGKELADAMRARHPELLVLFISGYADDILGEQALHPEGANFLQKPFTTTDLLSRVHALLKKV